MDMRRYLELFVAESRERIVAASRLHDALAGDPTDAAPWREFMRHAHSLKGMAAAMRYEQMVALAHAMEDIAERLQAAPTDAPDELLRLISTGLGCLDSMVDQAERGDEPSSERSDDVINGLAVALERAVDVLPDAPHAPAADEAGPDRPLAVANPTDVDRTPPTSCRRVEIELDPSTATAAERTVAVLRRLESVGRLVQADPPSVDAGTGRFTGRLSLALDTALDARGLERWIGALDGVRAIEVREDRDAAAPEASDAVDRARWIRVRAEAIDELVEQVLELKLEQARLLARFGERDPAARRHVSRSRTLLRRLHTDLIEMRLVPFDMAAHRLRQSVRQLSRELDKEVAFEIAGGEVRLDRGILDSVVDSLMHMVRNAIDHGLELPQERLALGKPRQGRLRLTLQRVGDRVRLALADDGRGICADHLRRTAVDLGLADAEAVGSMSDAEALLLTTLPRLSTARRVSHVSGRGVGLDVVRDHVEALGGSIEIRSQPGAGTELALVLPLTLASIRAVVVQAGGRHYALPAATIRRALSSDDLPPHVRAIDLGERFAGRRAADASSPAWALELRHVSGPAVLLVDAIDGRREVLVQPLQPPLSTIAWFSGCAMLDDGTVTLVVDPLPLVEAAESRDASTSRVDGTTMRG